MTDTERIIKLEKEISNLKEQISKNKKSDVWNEVKKQFKNEFESFNWEDVFKFTDYKGKYQETVTPINESYKIETSIRTIIKIVLKKRKLNTLTENDKDIMIDITKQILDIMTKEREIYEGNKKSI
jgi:hypothetical protein